MFGGCVASMLARSMLPTLSAYLMEELRSELELFAKSDTSLPAAGTNSYKHGSMQGAVLKGASPISCANQVVHSKLRATRTGRVSRSVSSLQ